MQLEDLILPNQVPPHTELLDLQPLPITALMNKEYESLFPFTHFNPIQTQTFFIMYHTDENALIGAPTGSGKTIIAEIAMLKLFRDRPGLKVVYIAPLKALVRERMKDWGSKFVDKLGKKLVELTGDYTPDMYSLQIADIVTTTPEKWDGISRNWKNRKYVKEVGLMIIDEIHLLGEERGPILEVIVSRMRYISSQTNTPIRVIGLSTALANADDLADWLGIDPNLGLFNFRPSVRPVPLEVHIQGYQGRHYCPRMALMNKPTYIAIKTHSPNKPVLIFVSSRRQTRLTALDLISYCVADESPRQFLRMNEEELEEVLERVRDPQLKHTLPFGIGLHHAGLIEQDKNICEELFAREKIQVLVSTATLAWGVNLPAHLVVIKGTEYFEPKTKRYVDYPITDILQMMGRAGRPQFDTSGVAVIMVEESKKSFYKKFLYEPFPVESSLKECLHDHINAEIVAGTITTKQDAVDYVTWTYFFRRLLKNPSYYHLEDTTVESFNKYLSDMVDTTLADLESAQCIVIEDEMNVAPLTLGRIASYYYLHYTTVKLFNDNINENSAIQDLLNILCNCSEYEELPVRHNEDKINAQLAELVPWAVDNRTIDSPHTKTNLLLQMHFSRLQMPISDYETDLKSVLDQAVRILQAMVDVTAEKGWLFTTLNTIHLTQMVVQGIWFPSLLPPSVNVGYKYGDASTLMTIPHFTTTIIDRFYSKGVESLPELITMDRKEIRTILEPYLKANQLDEALEIITTLPIIEVKYTLGSISPGQECELKISLKRLSREPRGGFIYAPRFPKRKEEGWWMILGDPQTGELLALRRLYFRRQTTICLSFETPEQPGYYNYALYLMSDSYMGLDQQYYVKFEVCGSEKEGNKIIVDNDNLDAHMPIISQSLNPEDIPEI
jgi:activating signal cointegrator complex subunit 3